MTTTVDRPVTIGRAVQVGRDGWRAVRFVMKPWKVYRFVGKWRECPHCGALVATNAAKQRHRAREARIEILLRINDLLEPDIELENY